MVDSLRTSLLSRRYASSFTVRVESKRDWGELDIQFNLHAFCYYLLYTH